MHVQDRRETEKVVRQDYWSHRWDTPLVLLGF